MDSYPSLQGNVEFARVEDAVRVLDAMIVRLRAAELHFRSVAVSLEHLPVKRRGRYQRDKALATLIREADKTSDILSVYGFGDSWARDSLSAHGL